MEIKEHKEALSKKLKAYKEQRAAFYKDLSQFMKVMNARRPLSLGDISRLEEYFKQMDVDLESHEHDPEVKRAAEVLVKLAGVGQSNHSQEIYKQDGMLRLKDIKEIPSNNKDKKDLIDYLAHMIKSDYFKHLDTIKKDLVTKHKNNTRARERALSVHIDSPTTAEEHLARLETVKKLCSNFEESNKATIVKEMASVLYYYCGDDWVKPNENISNVCTRFMAELQKFDQKLNNSGAYKLIEIKNMANNLEKYSYKKIEKQINHIISEYKEHKPVINLELYRARSISEKIEKIIANASEIVPYWIQLGKDATMPISQRDVAMKFEYDLKMKTKTFMETAKKFGEKPQDSNVEKDLKLQINDLLKIGAKEDEIQGLLNIWGNIGGFTASDIVPQGILQRYKQWEESIATSDSGKQEIDKMELDMGQTVSSMSGTQITEMISPLSDRCKQPFGSHYSNSDEMEQLPQYLLNELSTLKLNIKGVYDMKKNILEKLKHEFPNDPRIEKLQKDVERGPDKIRAGVKTEETIKAQIDYNIMDSAFKLGEVIQKYNHIESKKNKTSDDKETLKRLKTFAEDYRYVIESNIKSELSRQTSKEIDFDLTSPGSEIGKACQLPWEKGALEKTRKQIRKVKSWFK